MIAIIGSGFAGLGMGIRLGNRASMTSIFEKADSVAVPGVITTTPAVRATCNRISIRFRSRQISTGRACFPRSRKSAATWSTRTDRFDLRDHLRFGHELRHAQWDARRRSGGWRWPMAAARAARV
jgi:cation diffusion facilitator CzcD-associated flavoprotein CzcO